MVSRPGIRARGLAASLLIAAVAGAGCSRMESEAPAAEPAPPAAAAATPASEPIALRPSVEVAPAIEQAAPLLPYRGPSFGHRAGLHQARDDLRLSASAALVVDQDTGEILLGRNEDAVLPIASLTKLMTGIVITEAKLPMTQSITITEDDIDGERHSRSRLRVGTTLTRGDALQLALMSSENRAAHALGRTYPGGLPAFVQAMNRKARALGMTSTTYADPTGLSVRNQSTARDLARVTTAAAKHPLLAGYSTTLTHVLPVARGRAIEYRNSNRLVKNSKWNIDLQKTGYIVEAGWCMVLDTHISGRNLLMVLLDAGSAGNRIADAERIRRLLTSQAR